MIRESATIYALPWPKPKRESCYFYHTLDLPTGTISGMWDLRNRFDEYTGHINLTGKRVLDVGTSSGFLTWETEKRGATEVVSFDLDFSDRQKLLPFKDSIYCIDRPESERQRNEFFDSQKRSYWYAHHTLRSRAKVFYGDIENLPRELGHFDVALVAVCWSICRITFRHSRPLECLLTCWLL